MSVYHKVLVVLDLSSEAKQVLDRASSLKADELHLLHVVEPLITETPYDLAPVVSIEVEQAIIERAENFLAALKKDCGVEKSNASVRIGSIKGEILQAAEELDADLIVVGTHGRHGLGLLLGSVANAVLHGTPCDVLAVRIGK